MKTIAGVRKRDAPSYFKAVEALSGVKTEAQCFDVLLPVIFEVFGQDSEAGAQSPSLAKGGQAS